jgi:hypothetical protein
VRLRGAPLSDSRAAERVIDAAVARRLCAVDLHCCRLSPSCVPALTRLLGGDSGLSELRVCNGAHGPLLDAATAGSFADAIAGNSTLTALHLTHCGLWSSGTREAGALLGVLAAHGQLRTLSLAGNRPPHGEEGEAGRALGALLAAPALAELDVSGCGLAAAGMRPLCAALARGTALRALRCADNHAGAAFDRQCLLPAVRSNTSLRTLRVDSARGGAASEHALEAAALVAARPPHA